MRPDPYDRHPIAHVDAMPTRAQGISLFAASLRVSLVAILFDLCTADWASARWPILEMLREHRDQLIGIAAGWVAFEFLVFVNRARQAAKPRL